MTTRPGAEGPPDVRLRVTFPDGRTQDFTLAGYIALSIQALEGSRARLIIINPEKLAENPAAKKQEVS